MRLCLQRWCGKAGRTHVLACALALAVALAVALLATGLAGLPAAQAVEKETRNVRRPAVAGQFYPSSREELKAEVADFLAKADPQVPEKLKDLRPLALIVPHAGYPYSGSTAAFSYRLLQKREKPSRIILLGVSHHFALHRVLAVPTYTHYSTPLGEVPVDTAACQQLLRSKVCISADPPHRAEHGLEVQLPFLQVLWDEPPKIVPVLVGDFTAAGLADAVAALKPIIDENTVIVASTDFTHYGDNYEFEPFKDLSGKELAARIKALDMGAIKKIEALDAQGFLDYCEQTGATICGRMAVALLLKTLSGMEGVEGVSLRYASSSDVMGDPSNSVGYHAHAFYVVKKTK